MKITFIRHGKTAGNLAKQYIGSTNEPLCEEGRKELEAYREQGLYPELSTLESPIFVSPMKRCMESAHVIFPGCKRSMVPSFQEMDFGFFEGKTYEELKDMPEYRKWIESEGLEPYPASEAQQNMGRTLLPGRDTYEEKVVDGFLQVYDLYMKGAPAESHFAAVVHGGTIMALMHGLGVQKKGFYEYQVKNGEMLTCEILEKDGGIWLEVVTTGQPDNIRVHFVGAGSGAADLITLRGVKHLQNADVIIYAGSLVNPALLDYKKPTAVVYDSAKMTLEETLQATCEAYEKGLTVVRLHTGDPCLYGAIREQMDALDEKQIAYDYTPGVSSFCGAAAALNLEYTLPEVSQSVIITRMEGRTPVPAGESIQAFAAHHATMVIFLSTGMLEELQRRLIEGGYEPNTPAAIVYKATWPEEKSYVCRVDTLAETAKREQITKTALIIVGDVVAAGSYARSKLYDPSFTTEFREGK